MLVNVLFASCSMLVNVLFASCMSVGGCSAMNCVLCEFVPVCLPVVGV